MKAMVRLTKMTERILVLCPWLIRLQQKYYHRIVSKEVRSGLISSEDNVLCIGGGPLPCTAIEIARCTGAHVVVIDCDPAAVHTAQQIVRVMGMENSVEVCLGDGRSYDASHFQVIHIARQAEPQEAILRNIWTVAPRGARILVRHPSALLKSCYCGLPRAYAAQCDRMENTDSGTLLFTKNRKELPGEIRAAGDRHSAHRTAYLAG